MKKQSQISQIIFEYLNNKAVNTTIPKEFNTRIEICEKTGMSQRRFTTIVRKARRLKMLEEKRFTTVYNNRIYSLLHYKFSPEIRKMMGLVSR